MFRIKPPPQRLGNRRIPGRRMHAPSSDTPPLNQTNHAKRRIPEPAPSLCVRGWGAVYRSSTPLLSNSSVHVGLIGFWKSLSCSSLKFWGQGDGVSRQFSVVISCRAYLDGAHTNLARYPRRRASGPFTRHPHSGVPRGGGPPLARDSSPQWLPYRLPSAGQCSAPHDSDSGRCVAPARPSARRPTPDAVCPCG